MGKLKKNINKFIDFQAVLWTTILTSFAKSFFARMIEYWRNNNMPGPLLIWKENALTEIMIHSMNFIVIPIMYYIWNWYDQRKMHRALLDVEYTNEVVEKA